MRVADFSFKLPDELIARYPTPNRTDSRLLVLDGPTGQMQDSQFSDLMDLLVEGDLLVFNNTKVIPARMLGVKESGGKVEVLVERVLDDHRVLAHVRASKSPKVGSRLLLEEKVHCTMLARHDTLFELAFDGEQHVFDILEEVGHMPLPPYIDRPDESEDKARYQTVYNKVPGAVAAPTAGLHFDQPLLDKLRHKGIQFCYVTLHVGAGTFQPVRVTDVNEHVMHAEYIEVPPETVAAIKSTKAAGNRIVAVGTTSVRSLESAAQKALEQGTMIEPFYGDTDIFIYPGKPFHIVDAMITNFHLPESTLLMLVSAFSGQENIKMAYQSAITKQYRFFSYGDAMFLTKK